MISLGGGLPSSTYFPFDHVGMRVPSKDNYTEELIAKNGTDLKIGKHDASTGNTTYGKPKAKSRYITQLAQYNNILIPTT